MKKTIVAVSLSLGIAGSASAQMTSDEIRRYFEDPRNNGSVLKEYERRLGEERQLFIVCTTAVSFNEAMTARDGAVRLSLNRKDLAPIILEYETTERDTFQIFKLNTIDAVAASNQANRECAEHAANLKILED